MQLTHSIEIDLPLEKVFDFVADARNDPQWCPRVDWCKQIRGDGPVVGARYQALEKPSLRKPQTRWIDVLTSDRPTRLVTRQIDEQGEFTIEYVLEPRGADTWLTQRDDVIWTLPKPLVPFARLIVARHIRDQLKDLKKLMETEKAAL
jgi:hypothetical protein